MANYSGLFILALIGWAAWATEKHFKQKQKEQEAQNGNN